MSDDIRCFMVVQLASGDVCLDYKSEPPRVVARDSAGCTLTRARLRPAEKTDRRNFAQEATVKVQGMAKQQQLVTDQTRMGMIFAETDDDLAYLVFVAPDYPERVAKQLVDKHARAVESMAGDGARLAPRPSSPRGRDCCRVRRAEPPHPCAEPSRLTRPLWGWLRTGTFSAAAGAGQSGGAKKAYAAVCKTLASECVSNRRRCRLLGLTRGCAVVRGAGTRGATRSRR